MNDFDIREVKQFYDSIGWQMTEEGVYQNAHYEDLRPVSRNYIHKCHLRVNRHLTHSGKYLLDAGSGPIQYPEYLTYSEGYSYRVCLDLSHVALVDARKRIGDHGLFVVADVANLPFCEEVFDGIVSLHTFHHLPKQGRVQAYQEAFRVLKRGTSAVIVNGWNFSPLMTRASGMIRLAERLFKREIKLNSTKPDKPIEKQQAKAKPAGTFVEKFDATTFKKEILPQYNARIYVWRSVSVRFLRAVIHKGWGGKVGLGILYFFEELFPRYFGEKGQYPLIVIKKKEE
jgi:ubiquinone/menaquinone biosynthesis C-methylase UbiE